MTEGIKERQMNVEMEKVKIGKEDYFKISNNDAMRPFFMSIVSDSNHWMFISSNGGLTAGRKNSEFALFPYYTDDKITESAEITGSKTIFQIQKEDKTVIWEPFSDRFEGKFRIIRNLYKNTFGNKIIFEEINHDLQLIFRYGWSFSNSYGFVKSSTIVNLSSENRNITVLDGIQNIVPYGIGSDLQNKVSNLADAYKRSEILQETGIGIFALSAIIVDKAEPSEALKANIAFALGLENPEYLLSSLQLKNFRSQKSIHPEDDIKGEKGAYFIHSDLEIPANSEKKWMIVANVNQTHSAIHQLSETIKSNKDFADIIEEDIEVGTQHLIELNASADALQFTADDRKDARHFSNTLFNIMRGGIFDYNYQIEKKDFIDYLSKANSIVQQSTNVADELPEIFSLSDLKLIIKKSDNNDFKRLATEYLPLKFSRRHGDPSRPWNQFSINTRSEIDGSKILDYEGNWRDIFQNWEVLAHSYPEFIEGMIFKFLNASTLDGYNPYRVTKGGFDWETIEQDDPWSYIGYWGDHQIIYLLKFLEFIENHQPKALSNLFHKDEFVYANIPYKIKSYKEILKNPKDTIIFDEELDKEIRKKITLAGADGALLSNQSNEIHHVNFIEKILATVLAKLSNFIPEGGIWMNTQRPEWNDANNALVGNGISMVTLCYLRRFLQFLKSILENPATENVEISEELMQFFLGVKNTLEQYQSVLSGKITDETRKKILDGLGQSGSHFRNNIYENGFSGSKTNLNFQELSDFAQITNHYLQHSIDANKRNDGLYHAYNLMTADGEKLSISSLTEMLEGQVAVLSSGYLSAGESLQVLDALRKSSLYREDQHSYILYPNKNLAKFIEKNIIPQESFAKSELLQEMVSEGNTQIVEKDIHGNYHFNGNFRNANDVKDALDQLNKYKYLTEKETGKVLDIFEQVFNHKEFTGRSMTFYGYEGLGSIYWHMVSKLLLATQETIFKGIKENEDSAIINRLISHYYDINNGIGVHKSPDLYGAFPTDPYSHTPFGKGAQQPGMTGQVKEDILARFGELGVFVQEGRLHFQPSILKKSEFLTESQTINFVDIFTQHHEITLEENSLFFTYCQIPVVYKISVQEGLEVCFNDQNKKIFKSPLIDKETSRTIFQRTGKVTAVTVFINKQKLQ